MFCKKKCMLWALENLEWKQKQYVHILGTSVQCYNEYNNNLSQSTLLLS